MTAQEVIKKFMASLDIQNYDDAISALDEAVKKSSRFNGIQDAVDTFLDLQKKIERDAIKTILELNNNYKEEYADLQLSDLLEMAETDTALAAVLNTKSSYPFNSEYYGKTYTYTLTNQIRMLTANNFLAECGIELQYYWMITSEDTVNSFGYTTGNYDTGGITGSDAGGNTTKTSDTTVPEIGNKYDASNSAYRQNITTGTNDWIVKATDYNDTITTGGSDSVDAGEGADVVYVTSDNATIKTGAGDLAADTVNIASNVKVATISDLEEFDTLNIAGSFDAASATLDSSTDIVTVTDKTGEKSLTIENWTTAKNSNVSVGSEFSGKLGEWLSDFISYSGTSTGTSTSQTSQPAAITVNLSEVTGLSGSFSAGANLTKATYSETSDSGNAGTVSSEFPDITTFTSRGLTVELWGRASNTNPKKNGGLTTLTLDTMSADEKTVFKGLYKWWIKEGLKLNEEAYNLGFTTENVNGSNIKVFFYTENSGTLAFVRNYESGKDLELGINMAKFSGISEEDESGNSEKLSSLTLLLDRTIAHELNHVIMAANVNKYNSLPQFVTEGYAELVHGIDDERGNNIFELAGAATDTTRLETALRLVAGTGEKDAYSGGYMFLRWFAKQAAADTESLPALGEVTVTVSLTGDNANYYAGLTSKSETAVTIQSDDKNYSVGTAEDHTYTAATGIKQVIRSNNDNWKFTEIGNENILIAGSGADSVTVKGSKDSVSVGDGENNVSIYGGNDHTVNGGADRDVVQVLASSNNLLNVGGGNNYVSISSISLESGKNSGGTITGNADNNTVTASGGNDNVILYGSNKNTLSLGHGSNVVSIVGGSQNTVQTGQDVDDVTFGVIGEESNTFSNYIDTGDGKDKINVFGMYNTIKAGSDSDVIFVRGKYNFIDGGEGGDQFSLYGNYSEVKDNTITGGEGADYFILREGVFSAHITDFSVSQEDRLYILYTVTDGSFSGNSMTFSNSSLNYVSTIYMDNTDSIVDFLDMSIYLDIAGNNVTTLRNFMDIDGFYWQAGTYNFLVEDDEVDIFNRIVHYTSTQTGKTYATVTVDESKNLKLTNYTKGTVTITPPSTSYINATIGTNTFTFNSTVKIKNAVAYDGDFSASGNNLVFYDSGTVKTLANTGASSFIVSVKDTASVSNLSKDTEFEVYYGSTTETYVYDASEKNIEKSTATYVNNNKNIKESIFYNAEVQATDNIFTADFVETTHYLENSSTKTVTLYKGSYTFANGTVNIESAADDGITFTYTTDSEGNKTAVGISNFGASESIKIGDKTYTVTNGKILRDNNTEDYYNMSDWSEFFTYIDNEDYWGIFTGWKVVNGTARYYELDKLTVTVTNLSKTATKNDIAMNEDKTVTVFADALSTSTTVSISDNNYKFVLDEDVTVPEPIYDWQISGNRAMYTTRDSAGFSVTTANKIVYTRETARKTLATITGLNLTGVTLDDDGNIPGITVEDNYLIVDSSLLGTTAVTYTGTGYLLELRNETSTSLLGGTTNDTISLSDVKENYYINAMAGNDTVTISELTDSTNAVFEAYGGAGNDSMTFNNVSASGNGIKISGDNGADFIDMESATVIGTLSISGGTDNDTLYGENIKVTRGTFDFAGGAGNDSISLKDVTVTDGIANINGEAGNDSISVENVSVSAGGTMNIAGGDGNDYISADTFSFEADLTISGGANNDIISVKNVSQNADISIDGGLGNDSISVANATLEFATYLQISGADGPDTVVIDNVTSKNNSVWSITGGAGKDVISVNNVTTEIESNLTFETGADDDKISLSNATINSDKVEIYTGAGNDYILISDTTLQENVTFNITDEAGKDTISVSNVQNNGNSLVISAGSDNNLISVKDSNNIVITGGGGADTLAFDASVTATINDFSASNVISLGSAITHAVFEDGVLYLGDITLNLKDVEDITAYNNMKVIVDGSEMTMEDLLRGLYEWQISDTTATYANIITINGINPNAKSDDFTLKSKTVTLKSNALSSNTTVTITEGYTLALDSKVTLSKTSNPTWTVTSGTALYAAAVTAGYTLTDNQISYRTAGTGTAIITINGLNTKANRGQLTIKDTTVTINNVNALSQENTVTITEGYNLALAAGIATSKTANPTWTFESGTAIYASAVTTGYHLENNEIFYRNEGTGTAIITINGLNENSTENQISLNDTTVTVSNDALSQDKTVTINEGYTLALAGDVTPSELQDLEWDFSEGTAIYSANITAGYNLEDNQISYREASTGTAIITINGLDANATENQISLSDTTVTISDSALDSYKTVTINEGYTLALANDVTESEILEPTWKVTNGTAVYATDITEGYTVSDNQISYVNEGRGEPILTVSNLNAYAADSQITLSDTTVVISKGALFEDNIVTISDNNYTLTLADDVTKSETLSPAWEVSNGTAVYTSEITAGYLVEDNTIRYQVETTTEPLITVNGLSTSAKSSQIKLNGKKVTVSKGALSTATATLTGEGYTFALDTDVTESKTLNPSWKVEKGKGIYSSDITEGYILSNNEITYQPATEAEALAIISNLSEDATAEDIKSTGNKVIVYAHALEKSVSNIVRITDGYDLTLDKGVTITKTVAEGWQVENGVGEYRTESICGGFFLENNAISYVEDDGGDLVVEVTGLKKNANVKYLSLDTETKTVGLASAAVQGEVTVTEGYTLDMAKGTYIKSTISGGEGKDTIVNNGNNLVINTGTGDDLITLGSGTSNNTINAGEGEDSISATKGRNLYLYAEGDGDDVITGLTSNDTLKITSGKIDDWKIDNNDLILIVGTGKITIKDGKEQLINIAVGNEKSQAQIYSEGMIANDKKTAVTLVSDMESYNAETISSMITINGSALSPMQITGNSKANIITGNGTIDGGNGNDTIYGGESADSLVGGAGADKLYGNAGNDTLSGGKGNDTLTGGDGNDVFVYGTGDGSDVITDYNEDEDAIYIGDATISSISVATTKSNPKVTFKIGTGTLVVNNGAGKKITINDTTKIYEKGKTYTGDKTSVTLTSAETLDSKVVNIDASVLSTAFKFAANDLNNSIISGKGADSILGGDGNDTIYGNAGTDKIWGDAGDDVLDGGAGNDTLNGGEGNDSLNGGAGNDTLRGGTGNNTLTGGDGNDIFIYEDGNDLITDYAEDKDKIQIVDSISKVSVEDDNVIFTTSKGTITIVGGKGKKITTMNARKVETTQIYSEGITWNDKKTSVTIGAGYSENYNVASDTKMVSIDAAEAEAIQITGNAKNNMIIGNGTLSGGKGNDTTQGGDGADSLLGDAGTDRLFGNGGNDTLHGGAGNDYMYGGDGADVFIYNSGDGNDVIADYSEEDRIVIGNGTISSFTISGKDLAIKVGTGTLKVKEGLSKKITINDSTNIYEKGKIYDSDKISVTLNAAATATLESSIVNVDGSTSSGVLKLVGNGLDNSIQGGKSTDSILGGAGADTIYGNAGADKLFGGDGNDVIDGGLGNDSILGGAGNDSLLGDAGNDSLYGGDGNDTLTGGDGNDTFVYENGSDIITDYAENKDKILLKSALKSTYVSGTDVIFQTDNGTLTVKDGANKKITVKNSIGKTTTQTYSRTLELFDSNNFLTDTPNLDSITEQKFTVQNIENQDYDNLAQDFNKLVTYADK